MSRSPKDTPRPTEEQRIARLEKAVSTLAWWLVQAQTGFGIHDAQGIEDILNGESDEVVAS